MKKAKKDQKKAKWLDLDQADIGYKVMRGDYIVMTTTFGMQKAYKVNKCYVNKVRIQTRQGRDYMFFPRFYGLPYEPIQRLGSAYSSPNKWHVRPNDKITLRLKYT